MCSLSKQCFFRRDREHERVCVDLCNEMGILEE